MSSLHAPVVDFLRAVSQAEMLHRRGQEIPDHLPLFYMWDLHPYNVADWQALMKEAHFTVSPRTGSTSRKTWYYLVPRASLPRDEPAVFFG
jgi:hypothetical protein